MFCLINSSPLEITLDPVLSEESLPSVAFDITADWLMPYHQAQLVIKECWFEYLELNRFEGDLKRLINRQIDTVKLNNLSLKPIMLFERNSDEINFEFIAADSANLGTVSIKTILSDQEAVEIMQNIQNWGKWW